MKRDEELIALLVVTQRREWPMMLLYPKYQHAYNTMKDASPEQREEYLKGATGYFSEPGDGSLWTVAQEKLEEEKSVSCSFGRKISARDLEAEQQHKKEPSEYLRKINRIDTLLKEKKISFEECRARCKIAPTIKE